MNMARAHELRPEQVRWGKRNSIEATHSRKLPALHCPNCGAWALTGIIYPSVDTSALNGIALPETPWPHPFRHFLG
jgi:hypothetical protein